MNNQEENHFSQSSSWTMWLVMFMLSAGILMTGCRSSKYSGETTSYKPAQSGLIYLKSGGYGKTKPGSVNNAIENAFKNLLLKGIPNSNQSTPLLGNNALEVFANNKRFFDKFLAKEKDQYIMDRSVSGYNFLNINTPSTEVTMTVNLRSLRQYLVQNKVLKGFGL